MSTNGGPAAGGQTNTVELQTIANGASMASTEVEEKKSLRNKPKDSALRQQRLPAWQPILTASTVIPLVFAIGAVFIPIGIALLIASENVHEKSVKYTTCSGSPCRLQITLDEDFSGQVYLYYYLEEFYQNHRRYVKNRNDRQYIGNLQETTDCEPFAKDEATGKPIAPCGAIANSMFNDTFSLKYIQNSVEIDVPVTTNGVLWSIDKDVKFKNPPIPAGQTLCDVFKDTVKPPNWSVEPCLNGGFENVDFIIWMRTAALPNFRKLWRLVDQTQTPVVGQPDFRTGLPKGSYVLYINNNFPVTSFGGQKSFVLSTTSWAGGKNSFMGIAYIVIGSISIVIGIIFIFIHVKFGYSLNEMSNIGTSGN